MLKSNTSIFTFFLRFFSLLFFTSLFISCEDEEDLGPPPTVGFESSIKVGEIGELINFNNNSTSQNGDSLTYQWNFGDGDLSTNPNPSHFYSDTGNYIVSLTATTAMGASEVFEEEIKIGRRYLTSLELLDWTDSTFAFTTNSMGEDSVFLRPWDEDNSAPDIAWVLFGPNNQELDTRTDPALNVTQRPFVLNFTGDFLLQNAAYTIAVGDVDEVADSVDWMIIRQDNDFAPTNPNQTIHASSQSVLGEREFSAGKNPETGEGSVIVGGVAGQPYFDLAVGLLNFEIR